MAEFLECVKDNVEWLFSGLGVVVLAYIGRLIFKNKGASSNQTISSGDSSTNIQVGRDMNIKDKQTERNVEER